MSRRAEGGARNNRDPHLMRWGAPPLLNFRSGQRRRYRIGFSRAHHRFDDVEDCGNVTWSKGANLDCRLARGYSPSFAGGYRRLLRR